MQKSSAKTFYLWIMLGLVVWGGLLAIGAFLGPEYWAPTEVAATGDATDGEPGVRPEPVEGRAPIRVSTGSTRTGVNNFVLAIGCGLGTSIAAQKILYEALKTDAALVLDADALNLLARHADLQGDLRARKAPSVITPHPGEAARLLGISSADVQSARTQSAQQLAKKLHCAVVLKGAYSLCATRDGRLYVNRTGNPGMSAAGMGDVLAGMIAAFIAQGMTADDALLLAVHLHGAAGDALAAQHAAVGMTATEVTEWARWLLNQWT